MHNLVVWFLITIFSHCTHFEMSRLIVIQINTITRRNESWTISKFPTGINIIQQYPTPEIIIYLTFIVEIAQALRLLIQWSFGVSWMCANAYLTKHFFLILFNIIHSIYVLRQLMARVLTNQIFIINICLSACLLFIVYYWFDCEQYHTNSLSELIIVFNWCYKQNNTDDNN